jgi:hypothetical protein
MKLKAKCIGSIMNGKAENGMLITCTIVDDKRVFKLYKDLGFDVFEKKVKDESTKGDSK